MEIAVVILNWNGLSFLKQFLAKVVANTPSYATIVIADNNSEDDSVAWVKKNFRGVQLVQNKENGGFAAGYNDALKHVNADYYVLLNSDIEVPPGWLEPMYRLMCENHEISACQPKILSYNNKEYFEHAGAAGGMLDYLGYPFCRGRIFNTVEKDTLQYNKNCEIFWATGACMMIRSDDFRTAGGFDTDFFAHMEEIDLCWRLKNTGKKIWYCSESHVYHIGGGTLNYMSPFKTYLNFRNSLYTLVKNTPHNLWLYILIRLLLDGIAGLKFILSGQFEHTMNIIYAHLTFYHNFCLLLYKRKKLKMKNINSTGRYKKSIVVGYFFKRSIRIFGDIPHDDFMHQ